MALQSEPNLESSREALSDCLEESSQVLQSLNMLMDISEVEAGSVKLDLQEVDILDLMHVLPRVWEAAHVFRTEGSVEAVAFVRDHLTRILQGEIGVVIGVWRRKARCQGLTGAKKKSLAAICAFLERNKHRMKYDEYLRQGCPVATGVIEGACRHVIKDRMERAGMRWKVPGAQAMLDLRTIHTNGDWAAFQEFRMELEKECLYPNTKAFDAKNWSACLAA